MPPLVAEDIGYSTGNGTVHHNIVPVIYSLNTDHQYYFQVQRQLLCTGRQTCRFVVFTLKGLEVIDVHRDDIFIDYMTKVLLDFYERYFKVAIIKKYLYKDEHQYHFSP